MSKKNKNKYQQQQQKPSQPPPPPPPAEAKAGPLAEAAGKLHAESLEGVSEAELERLTRPAPPPTPPSVVELEDALRKAQEARQLWGLKGEKLEERQRQVDTRLAEAEARERELDARKVQARELEEQLARRAAGLDDRDAELSLREAQRVEREAALRTRELDAEAGFVVLKQRMLQRLEEEASALRQRMEALERQRDEEVARVEKERAEQRRQQEEALRKERDENEVRLRTERHQQEEALRRKRDEHDVELRSERQKWREQVEREQGSLAEQRDGLAQRERDLQQRQKELDWDRQTLTEDRADLERRVEEGVAQRKRELDDQLAQLQEDYNRVHRERDQLTARLAAREELDRRFGNLPPEEVLTELRSLRAERDTLKTQLASRLGEEAEQQLQALQREQSQWRTERLDLLRRTQELEDQLSRSQVAVTQLEALRDQKAALESARDLLHATLDKLREDVKKSIHSAQQASPFPALSRMDADPRQQTARAVEETPPDLKELVRELRQRMAKDPATPGKELYYSPRHVRSFLAGLAMSRLHLLQGISGTGKSSLPQAVARALGAGCTLVEVQAGWRDRQDLLGHFNAFDQRYHETEFLQALYKAQGPYYQDVPYLIVLDEMNLSHPEQYFADLISALEADPRKRRLHLMPAPIKSAPQLLEEQRSLKLPPNVWFIGTANHDETTKGFADKTYDRAHVMELPRHRESFKPEELLPRQQPLGVAALQKAFDRAREKYAKEAAQAYGFLEKHLAELLGNRFRIGWGNRLERQMLDFVPVVLAAGGTAGEAVDHVLATKLLRKLRDRHDTRTEDLVSLRETLNGCWRELDKVGPKDSLALLAEELKRLGAGVEVEGEEAAA
jgi:hypothetical protein